MTGVVMIHQIVRQHLDLSISAMFVMPVDILLNAAQVLSMITWQQGLKVQL